MKNTFPSDEAKGDPVSSMPAQNPRYSVTLDSQLFDLAEAATAHDRSGIAELERLSGFVLGCVVKAHGWEQPFDGTAREFATVAASVERVVEKPDIPVDPFDLMWGSAPARDAAGESEATAETEKHGQSEVSESEPPLFPGFDPEISFNDWTHSHVDTDDAIAVGVIMGTATPRTFRNAGAAMTLVHGLPLFTDRARAGEFALAHVQVVTDLCRTVALRYLPGLDRFLASRRADVTADTLRTSLRKQINLVEPSEDRHERIAASRRVTIDTDRNGQAYMTVIGPALELNACYLRIEAMARAIHAGQADTFGLSSGVHIIDERGIGALMYDIVTRPQPKLKIKVTSVDSVTGIQTATEIPYNEDSGEFPAPYTNAGGRSRYGKRSVHSTRAPSAFFPNGIPADEDTSWEVVVGMPMHDWWVQNQARMLVTVPFLTAFGNSDLPGCVPGGAPIPAETARLLARGSSTLTRILTDPATGTPVDAKATNYRIPSNVRTTVVAQWSVCTVPGCSRKAETSEIDHVEPFFHLEPLKGGLTRFGNLHPLCKKHHAEKTARNYQVRMRESGFVEFSFSQGVSTRVMAPDQPVDIAQAAEMLELSDFSPGPCRIPPDLIPPPPPILELLPGATEIARREERLRLEQAAELKKRRKQELYERAVLHRKQLMIERSLNWSAVKLQKCLPPGKKPLKQLCPPRPNKPQSFPSSQSQAFPKSQSGRSVRSAESPLSPSRSINWDHDLESDPPPF